MQLVKLSELFDLKYGVNLELYSLDESEKREDGIFIPFVSRTENNNGVSAFVKYDNNIKPISANTLTVAAGGSVLSTFLQPYEYYSGRDLYYLIPKKQMTERELIYYSICIKKNKYKYSYGRQANKTLKNILVPESIPDRFLDLKIENLNKKTFLDNKVSFQERRWNWFKISDLFEVTGTKTTKKEIIQESGVGIYPYVTTQATNNGVEGYYNLFTEKGNVMVIDSAVKGFCSYQEQNFSASDHVEKLSPKFKLNKFIGLFLQTIINLEQFRYSYGRKFNQIKIRATKIKLPVDKNGNPDWQFMEDYIKSLPYSASL